MSDKAKKKSILSTILFYVYLIGVLAFTLFGPQIYYRRGGGNARIKSCYSNIRVLQGAVEMYNMDVNTMMSSLNQSILIEMHYIKANSELVCPETSKHGTYSGEHLTDDGEIICSYHGGLIAEGQYDKEKPSLSERRRAEIQKYLNNCFERIPFALAWPLLLLIPVLGTIEKILRH